MPHASVSRIIDSYRRDRSALLAILQDIQDSLHYIPREAMELVARELRMPLIDVYGAATFYRAFSLEPRGEHQVTVCVGTACHVRGAPRIVDELERRLKVRAGQTTPDGKFTLETVNCLGCCAIGPIVVIDGEYHGQLTTNRAGNLLARYQKPSAPTRKAKRHETRTRTKP